jgi:hypothetical protein
MIKKVVLYVLGALVGITVLFAAIPGALETLLANQYIDEFPLLGPFLRCVPLISIFGLIGALVWYFRD